MAQPTANGVVACARLPKGYSTQKMHHVDDKLKRNIQYKTRGILKPHLVLKIICFSIYVDSLQMDLGAQPEMFLLLLQEACRHDKCMILDDFQNQPVGVVSFRQVEIREICASSVKNCVTAK